MRETQEGQTYSQRKEQETKSGYENENEKENEKKRSRENLNPIERTTFSAHFPFPQKRK